MLGPVQAVSDGASLPLGGPKQRALLAELLLHGGGVVPRDRLVDAIWGEEPPESAKASLQVYVHGLRRAVGADRIETHGDGYRLRLEPQELDLARFERLVASAERSLGERRVAAAADELSSALALWHGPALADLADQPVARAAAPRLEELRLRALELHNDARLELGEHDALLPELDALVAREPYRERLREQQILALYRAGRQTDALEAYRAARQALVEGLGVEPGPALRELERAILRHDESLVPPAAPARVRRTVPTPATPLVGRRLEIAAVEALLRREDVRLVTLTGPGGTGKTRLALAVAAALGEELRDGACFVDLSTVTDEALVLASVARGLSLAETDDPLEHLRDRSLLLVLDNLEQLGDGVAPVATMLAAAPRLRVLATSRTSLRLSGEHEYPVPPLPVPPPGRPFEELTANESVRLFAERARAASPDFILTDATIDPVAEICRGLDGIPLALELAAARTRALPVTAIAQRLTGALELLVEGARDLPPRQRTLRATLDWSHGLLPATAQQLLARVSVFAGTWALADLEAVVGESATPTLAQLVEASLVRHTEGRYRLLETVRSYAAERLRGSGEDGEYRRRHALRFLAVAEDARERILEGGDAAEEGFAALVREEENLRSALAWTVEAGEPGLEVRLCVAQRWAWLVRGQNAEARRAFAHAVEVSHGDARLHALALHGDATFALKLNELVTARRNFEQARELFRGLDDVEWIGRCTAELAAVAVEEGDLDDAEELYRECVTLFDQLGDDSKTAVALGNLAAIAARQGDAETAAEYGRRAIELQRRIDNRDDLTVSLGNLARVLLALHRTDEARAALRETIELSERIGYRFVLAHAFGAAAELAVVDADLKTGARLLGASEALFAAMGMQMPADELREQAGTHARLAEALEDDTLAGLLDEGRRAPFEAMIEEALAVTR